MNISCKKQKFSLCNDLYISSRIACELNQICIKLWKIVILCLIVLVSSKIPLIRSHNLIFFPVDKLLDSIFARQFAIELI